MDMKASFKLTDQKRYLLVRFGGRNVALYAKDNIHVDAYEGWKNSDDIEIEELQPHEVGDRLTESNKDEGAEQLGKIFRQMLKLKTEFGE